MSDPLAEWDWKSAASLAALELDQHPEWDNYDRAVNTIINGLVAAADVLTSTADMSKEERSLISFYYWAQVARVSREYVAERGVTNPPEADENADTPPPQL